MGYVPEKYRLYVEVSSEEEEEEEIAHVEEVEEEVGEEESSKQKHSESKLTIEMVDAYKEHPDILSRVLVDFLEHQRRLVQEKFGENGQPTGTEHNEYSRVINDAIDLQKKIADGNGKTHKYARKLEKKIKHFNNTYAHSFVALDLTTVVQNLRSTVMGEPADGVEVVQKRKEAVVVGLVMVTDDHIRSENVEYDNMCFKEKKTLFTMGFAITDSYNLLYERVAEENSAHEEDYESVEGGAGHPCC
ncbi:hypothetical protein EDD11_003262 [Mortierella claussenii]|nr:hypothetical protein EDD11_003262 [Mortierella claussenii]